MELAEVEGLKRKLIRCEKCALTPKPLVLETPGRSTKAMKPLRLALPAHLLKFRDGKAKAAHD